MTAEGILGYTRGPEDGETSVPLRLIDFRAPELPVLALSGEPVEPLAGFVGPRASDAIAFGRDRLQTGHFASPYLMRTAGGTVLHVDRDTWTTTTVLEDVASLVPSPDGRAFAYRPRLADNSTGDLRVRLLASGEEFTVASAKEFGYGGPGPWWSADGSLFAAAVTVDGESRDRLLALPSGATAVTPVRSHVQRELEDGALWLLGNEAGGDREYYWEPFADVTRTLYVHRPVAGWYRRATAEGLELIEITEGDSYAADVPGTLMLVPWDGSKPEVLAEEVYSWYRRTADGRVFTTRAKNSNYDAGEPMDLVLIDGDHERVIDRNVVPSGSLLDGDGDHEGGYFRILGDLLIYAVHDDEHRRSGVWAVNVSQL